MSGCREAAVNYLTVTGGGGFQPKEFQIMAIFGLLNDDRQTAVDLTQFGKLKGENYTHVGGVCGGGGEAATRAPAGKTPSAVSITLDPSYHVLAKGAGCLVATDGATAPKPYAVVLVKPPPAAGMFGGQVVSQSDLSALPLWHTVGGTDIASHCMLFVCTPPPLLMPLLLLLPVVGNRELAFISADRDVARAA